jgi:hypothetical protein
MYDFEPYFCTFAECETPFDVPNSFEELLAHMQSHVPVVGYATRQIEPHQIVKPHGLRGKFYGSTLEVSTEQTMDATDAHTHAIAKKGPFLFDDCPFCGGYPELLEKRFPDRETLDAQLELRKHVKKHMQEIALYLPPYRSDAPSISDGSKDTAITHHPSSITDIGDVSPESNDICDREECDCKIFEEVEEPLVPLIDSTKETETRWQCCRCGEDYALDSKDVCMHGHLHRSPGCVSCHRYVRDCSLEGDWGRLLQGLSLAEVHGRPVTREGEEVALSPPGSTREPSSPSFSHDGDAHDVTEVISEPRGVITMSSAGHGEEGTIANIMESKGPAKLLNDKGKGIMGVGEDKDMRNIHEEPLPGATTAREVPTTSSFLSDNETKLSESGNSVLTLSNTRFENSTSTQTIAGHQNFDTRFIQSESPIFHNTTSKKSRQAVSTTHSHDPGTSSSQTTLPNQYMQRSDSAYTVPPALDSVEYTPQQARTVTTKGEGSVVCGSYNFHQPTPASHYEKVDPCEHDIIPFALRHGTNHF